MERPELQTAWVAPGAPRALQETGSCENRRTGGGWVCETSASGSPDMRAALAARRGGFLYGIAFSAITRDHRASDNRCRFTAATQGFVAYRPLWKIEDRCISIT